MTNTESEHKTMCAMIQLYCRAHHSPQDNLCLNCQELVHYSRKRLENCPFQKTKPTCGNCTIHCYKKEMRKRAQEVMRYSGPRMIWHHPIMAITHLLDSFKKVPQLPKKKNDATDTS